MREARIWGRLLGLEHAVVERVELVSDVEAVIVHAQPSARCERRGRMWCGAVDAAVAPVQVLVREAQNQHSNGSDGAGSARAFWSRRPGVVSAEEVAMPAQDRVWADQQTKPVQGVAW
ncbi:hypothetical protein SAMN05661093_08745 [Kibdelosporangium aridum]|uniref:Uncharacterized protein n=1 Tax=Kibdelosporangium aridum TaxID=2030 RepID=A0A1W2FRZ4_KIBAR|nr:hypothetical protein SAMN05661093_08745 [Kibdelosporangium aridum]